MNMETSHCTWSVDKAMHTETRKLLVSQGADSNEIYKRGQTPLRTVDYRWDCPELCLILLDIVQRLMS